MRQDSSVTVCYAGDGAVEEGGTRGFEFCLVKRNTFSIRDRNNLFASHMDLKDRQPLDPTARFARANNIPFDLVDGNDVVQVSECRCPSSFKG